MEKAELKEWPVEKGDYILGNPAAPSAIVTPMPDRKIWKEGIEAGAAIAGRMLTANIGIEKIICNILANPNIRYLILCGKESEGHLAGEGLAALFRNGVDGQTRRIKGSKAQTPYVWNIPEEGIERFRKQVTLINLLGTEDAERVKQAVRACYQEKENKKRFRDNEKELELYDPGAYAKEPLIVRIENREKGSAIEALSENAIAIYSKTIGGAWENILETIRVHGEEMEDERGTVTREVMNLMVHIKEPLENMIPKGYSMNKDSLEDYAKGLMNSDRKGFAYTYGQRMRDFKEKDQIQYVIEKIRKNPNTRRAVASLWDPLTDSEKEEVPCLSFLEFMKREGKLNLTAVLRSNEMEKAWPANAYGLARLLEHVAKETGAEPGTLTTLSISAHIYLNR